MTYAAWQDALSVIRARTSPCDNEQLQLAAVVGAELPDSLPRVVAAARLQSAIAERFGLSQPTRSDPQMEFLAELACEASEDTPAPESKAEAQAWIKYFYLKRRAEALCHLRLNRGNLVSRSGSASQIDEVASIGDEGVVYFVGGRARAWPDELTVVAQSGDTSPPAKKARRTAANRASERSRSGQWSMAKAESLKQYIVPESADASDVEELRTAIESSSDERPLQELFKHQPRILASLLRGPDRYCIPEVRLGGRYVADFLLADVDSNGVRWILVELETPNSATALATSNQFDKHARKGVSQIEEWREWLQDNLDMARRSIQENGLGLPDIRPQAEGLVIVGRRDRLSPNAQKLRDQLSENSRIQMHTYDWLLERLEGVIDFSGPWATNPHAI